LAHEPYGTDMSMVSGLNVLILCDYHLPGSNANALADHINSFQKHSRHNIFVLSNVGDLPADFNLEGFDVLVIHYSIVVIGMSYLSEYAKDRIANYKGLKVQYIQDEYREINRFQIEIDRLGIDLLFTCVPQQLWKYTYPDYILPWLMLRPTLTGYVPEALLQLTVKPIAERAMDVFYRGRQAPYWIGSTILEKYEIAQKFGRLARSTELVVDLASEEGGRIYGDAWIQRLGNAKCTLGVESAASLLDFTGGIQRRTEAYMRQHPKATFAEVEAAAFPGIDNRFNTSQISPRCFEAAAMRTCMVLYEGAYSGILEPGRHYLPLKKDFSNFHEICATIRKPTRLQEISDCAFQEVALNPRYSYKQFITEFEMGVTEAMRLKRKVPRQIDVEVIAEQFQTAYTYYRPDVGRLHGPLYFRCSSKDMIYLSQAFEQHCEKDVGISMGSDKVAAVSLKPVTAHVHVIESINQPRPPIRRLLLGLWRSIPYSLRLKIEPLLLLIKR
jgi:hypothetical protein